VLLEWELPHFSIRLRKGSICSDIVLIPKRGWRCPIKNTQTFSVPQIPHLIPPVLHPSNANSNTDILSRQNLWVRLLRMSSSLLCILDFMIISDTATTTTPASDFQDLVTSSFRRIFDTFICSASLLRCSFQQFFRVSRLHIPKEDFHDQVA